MPIKVQKSGRIDSVKGTSIVNMSPLVFNDQLDERNCSQLLPHQCFISRLRFFNYQCYRS